MTPGYNFLNMIQAVNRFHRVNSKSDPEVSIVYLEGIGDELNILEALVKKSNTLKKMTGRETGQSSVIYGVNTLS